MEVIWAIGVIGSAIIGLIGILNLECRKDLHAALIWHDRLIIVLAIWIGVIIIAVFI